MMVRADPNWGHSALAKLVHIIFLSCPNHSRVLHSLYRGGNMTQSAKIKYFTHIRSRLLLRGPDFRPQYASTFSNSLF